MIQHIQESKECKSIFSKFNELKEHKNREKFLFRKIFRYFYVRVFVCKNTKLI
mgnify:CR=1 FL=1